MTRKMVAAPLNILCVLALADAGCRVYDSSLVNDLPPALTQDTGSSTNSSAVVSDAMPEEDDQHVVAACGNGRVDDAERCDTAIPRGQPGACPEACSGRDGCFKQKLAGQRCGARCEEVEITDIEPDDGCCPDGATTETDTDCSPSCGNGTMENGETCDPIESCPTLETCTSTQLCKIARFSGFADSCNARCELKPVEDCLSGDECCPQGCTYARDTDCPRQQAEGAQSVSGPSKPADAGAPPTDAGAGDASASMEEGDPVTCTALHSAGPCEACDCAYCSDEVVACATETDAVTRAASLALVDCATQNHCSGMDCYCGAFDIPTCERWSSGGPCVREIRALAGTNNIDQILALSATSQTPIGRAATMLACRNRHCSRACGLQ